MTIVFVASADIQDRSLWSSYSGSGATISNTTARTGTYSFKIINGYISLVPPV